MRHKIINFSALLLGWALSAGSMPAHAAKHARPHGRRNVTVAPQKPASALRPEQKLAPKKEYALDTAVANIKDMQPAGTTSAGPKLSLDALQLTQVEAMMDEKLEEEIKLSRDLLQFETRCEETGPVRYRLADLYWEKSKRDFFKANDAQLSEAQRAHHASLVKELQGNALGLYQSVIDDCPGALEMPKVLFYYGKSLMELERAKEASALFARIIKQFPTTVWVPQSWFMVGEYYFNTANNAKAALQAYQKAAQTLRTPIYGFALYKQGWCYINMAQWPLAQQRFEQVIQASQNAAQPLDERVRAALRKEALKDFVRAYANVGEARAAAAKFRSLAPPGDIAMMLEQLGGWYVAQGAHANVVTVYRELMRDFPQSSRLPIYQGRIVDAVSRLGNPQQTVAEVKQLSRCLLALRERAKQGDARAQDHDAFAKDKAESEDLAENTMRRLALDYNKEAKKLRGAAQTHAYTSALALYRHYLDVFAEAKPGAEVNYPFFMHFYYAEVLFKLEHFAEAARSYEAVVRSNPHPTDVKQKQVVLAASEEAVRAYDEIVTDTDAKHPPSISGVDPKPIPALKQSLLAACQRYIDNFGQTGDKSVEIRYKMARIYYTYNYFDKAAPAFDDIVQNHPTSPVACYAANLALDIYNGQKNYQALKLASRSYLDNQHLACGEQDRHRFGRIEEQSTFSLLKQQLEDKKKYIAAANAYLQFYRDHPTGELADDAVYNAAVNFDLGNRLDKANEVRRFLVDKLPNSKLVPETLYNMAQSFERVVDFDRASQYYEIFSQRFAADKRSKDAIYNAGVYRATLQQFDAARTQRQTFIKLYPNDPEVHSLAFANCESFKDEAAIAAHALRGAPSTTLLQQAHDCYLQYLRKYSRIDPDLACHAQAQRARVMSQVHNERGADELRTHLIKTWPTIRKVGTSKLPRCIEDVAQAQYLDLRRPFDAYMKLTISALDPSPRGKRAFDASRKQKIAQRDALVEAYKQVAALGVPQWSLAALYQIGALYVDCIDKFLAAPIAAKIPGYTLTAEDKTMLRQQLTGLAAPIEQQAVDAFELCVKKANELGSYNTWSVRALDALQKLRPAIYPLIEEASAAVAVAEPLLVMRNALVIGEGTDLKSVSPRLGPPPASAPPSALPRLPLTPAVKQGETKTAPEAPSDVPEPLLEEP